MMNGHNGYRSRRKAPDNDEKKLSGQMKSRRGMIPSETGKHKNVPFSVSHKNVSFYANHNDEGLTPKQQRFVDEYMKDYNATQAVIRTGYSKRTANVMGSQLLAKPNISKAIQRRRDKLAAKFELDREGIIERYKCLMDYQVSDFFNDDGTMKPLSEIPARSLYAIQGFKHNKKIASSGKGENRILVEDFIKEFNLPAKREVLDSVVKLLGLANEKEDKNGGALRCEIILPESVDRVADVLGILLGSGLVQRRLAEHSQRELSTNQQAIDAEVE